MLLMAADHEKSCFEQFNLGHPFVHTIGVAHLQRERTATPVRIKQRLKSTHTKWVQLWIHRRCKSARTAHATPHPLRSVPGQCGRSSSDSAGSGRQRVPSLKRVHARVPPARHMARLQQRWNHAWMRLALLLAACCLCSLPPIQVGQMLQQYMQLGVVMHGQPQARALAAGHAERLQQSVMVVIGRATLRTACNGLGIKASRAI